MNTSIQLGLALRDKGIELARISKNELVDRAREAMVVQALWGDVTADDVREWLVKEGYEHDALGNAMGSVFKCPQFVPVHRTVRDESGVLVNMPVRVQSRVPENHARLVQVWRLR